MREALPLLEAIRTRISEGQRGLSHGFRSYLDKLGWTLPPREYAGHLNYLKLAMPVHKALERLQRDRVFEEPRFTKAEQDVMTAAIGVLRRSLVPRARIKKGKGDEIVLL